ncbi:hypothetical protein PR048_012589 [Dryococelus australis]|uniref:DUF7869 domain-containing protein n=1 Tax=Dryococelus australis TaxID=614101 RepID=A0ABQ9HPT0_9NEOP|nr:hypothetical protein PR048_012589 [Dryococelus australis]
MSLSSRRRKIVELVLNKNEADDELSCGNGENELNVTNKSIVVYIEVERKKKRKEASEWLRDKRKRQRSSGEHYLNDIGLYKEDCKTKGITFTKSDVFKKAWRKDYNIGIHIPKKDKCPMCLAKEEGNLMVDAEKTTANSLLYCDSWPGKNKNHVVLSTIAYTLKQLSTITCITLNYLLPGHSYMPVDSVHSAIETNLKRRVVWAPSEWPTWIVNARTSPEPYTVYVMNYNDFKKWKPTEMMFFASTTKGTCFGRQDKVRVHFKIHCAWTSTGVDRLREHDDVDLPNQLYGAKIPIAAQKYEDLKLL